MKKLRVFPLCLFAVLASSCSVKSKKDNEKIEKAEQKPEEESEITENYVMGKTQFREKIVMPIPPNGTASEDQYVTMALTGTSVDDIGADIKILDVSGKDITKIVGLTPTITPHLGLKGLKNHEITIPFRFSEKTFQGVKIQVTLKNVKDEEGKPVTITTDYVYDGKSYQGYHRQKWSRIFGVPVLTDDTFNTSSVIPGVLEVAKLVKQGGAGLQADSQVDIMEAQEAFDIIPFEGKEIISLKGEVAFSLTDYGTATVRTNGYPLYLFGGDASNVTVEVGECLSDDCQSNIEVTAVLIEPPEFKRQGDARHGNKGEKPLLENRLQDCRDALIDSGIPVERADCSDQTFYGRDIVYRFDIYKQGSEKIYLPFEDITTYVDTGVEHNLLSVGQENCGNSIICYTPFNERVEQQRNGNWVLSKEGFSELNLAALHKFKHTQKGKAYFQEAPRSQNVYFVPEDKNIAGLKEAWTQDVFEWADKKCESRSGEKLKQFYPGRLQNPLGSEAVLSFDEYREGDKVAYEEKQLNFSELTSRYAVTDVQSYAWQQQDDGEQKLSLKILDTGISAVGKVSTGIPIADGYKKTALSDKEEVIQLSEFTKSLNRRLLDELKIQGSVGGDGRPSPIVKASFFNQANSMEQLKNLAGNPGAYGDDLVFEWTDFKPGQISAQVYDEFGKLRNDLLVNDTGVPCQYDDLIDGRCSITAYDSSTDFEVNEKVKLLWTYHDILGKIEIPYVPYEMAEGKITLKSEREWYPRWNVVDRTTESLRSVLSKGPGGAGSKLQEMGGQAGFYTGSFSFGNSGVRESSFDFGLKSSWLGYFLKREKKHYYTSGRLFSLNDRSGKKLDRNHAIIRNPRVNAENKISVQCAQYLPGEDFAADASVEYTPEIIKVWTPDSNEQVVITRTLDKQKYLKELEALAKRAYTAKNQWIIRRQSEPTNWLSVKSHDCDDQAVCKTTASYFIGARNKYKSRTFGGKWNYQNFGYMTLEVHWSQERQSDMVDKIRVSCQSKHTEIKNAKAKQALDWFHSLLEGKNKVYVDNLTKYSSTVHAHLKELQSILQNFNQNSEYELFSREDIPEHLRYLLDQEVLQGYYDIVNTYRNPEKNAELQTAFNVPGDDFLSWDNYEQLKDIQDKETKVPTRIQRIKRLWPEIPETVVFDLGREYIQSIMHYTRPKIVNLECGYELRGRIKFYTEEHDLKLSAENVTLGTPRTRETDTQMKKTWVKNVGEKKYIIEKPLDDALFNRVYVKTKQSPKPGVQREPIINGIGSCGDMINTLLYWGVPVPRKIFESQVCAPNKGNNEPQG